MDIKQIVSQNVRRLLNLGPNDRGATAALLAKGVSNGTATRVLRGETDIGIEQLQALADALHVQPWQLCVEGLDPDHLPTVEPASFRWPFRRIDPDIVTSLVGSVAQNVENGLLAALATAGVEPRKRNGTDG